MEPTIIINMVILFMLGMMVYRIYDTWLKNDFIEKCPKCNSRMLKLVYDKNNECLNMKCMGCGYTYTMDCYDKK